MLASERLVVAAVNSADVEAEMAASVCSLCSWPSFFLLLAASLWQMDGQITALGLALVTA